MLPRFFMNAAIDQACEKYILANKLGEKLKQKLKEIWDDKGLERPKYQGRLPDEAKRTWADAVRCDG